MPPKLNISDRNMLKLISSLKSTGAIRFNQDFFDEIDFLKQNFVNVKAGTQHFTVSHIENACKKYNVNANWIFGLEKEMFRGGKILVK